MSWYWLTVIAVIFLVVCGILAAVAIQLRQELEDKLADHDRLQTLWDNFPGVVTELLPNATFRVKLTAGKTHLKTWFYDAGGKELCGAFYVYVRRI